MDQKQLTELKKENRALRQKIERFEREKFEMNNQLESLQETVEKQVDLLETGDRAERTQKPAVLTGSWQLRKGNEGIQEQTAAGKTESGADFE